MQKQGTAGQKRCLGVKFVDSIRTYPEEPDNHRQRRCNSKQYSTVECKQLCCHAIRVGVRVVGPTR